MEYPPDLGRLINKTLVTKPSPLVGLAIPVSVYERIIRRIQRNRNGIFLLKGRVILFEAFICA